MITRIITALAVLIIFLPATLLLPPAGWEILALLLTAGAALEWGRLAGLGRAATAIFAAGVMIVCYTATVFPTPKIILYACSSAFWLLIAPYLLFRRRGTRQTHWVQALGLILLPAVFKALVDLREDSPGVLLVVMAIAWVSDSMAYFTGKAFGKNKLAPSISPGKTWEGVAGGLFGVTVYAIICFNLNWTITFNLSIGATILLWIALASTGIVGDLFESLMKRSAGVKDSGRVLPGHGGVLDRVDALLPILPIAAIVHHYMAA